MFVVIRNQARGVPPVPGPSVSFVRSRRRARSRAGLVPVEVEEAVPHLVELRDVEPAAPNKRPRNPQNQRLAQCFINVVPAAVVQTRGLAAVAVAPALAGALEWQLAWGTGDGHSSSLTGVAGGKSTTPAHLFDGVPQHSAWRRDPLPSW